MIHKRHTFRPYLIVRPQWTLPRLASRCSFHQSTTPLATRVTRQLLDQRTTSRMILPADLAGLAGPSSYYLQGQRPTCRPSYRACGPQIPSTTTRFGEKNEYPRQRMILSSCPRRSRNKIRPVMWLESLPLSMVCTSPHPMRLSFRRYLAIGRYPD